MKLSLLQRLAIVLVLVGLLAVVLRFATAQTLPSVTTVRVNEIAVLQDARRLGINIGFPNQYGASQLLQNYILNPGFEPDEFATLFFTLPDATAERVQQDNWETIWNSAGVGQPEGFWNDADYEVLTGPAAGQTGSVTRFTHEDGRYTYSLAPQNDVDDDGEPAAPGEEALIRVSKVMTGFEESLAPYNRADTTTVRPASPGVQSLQLLPSNGGWDPSFKYFLDSFGRDGDATAGKLLRVAGNWRFSIWARATDPGATLQVTFRREGLPAFLDQTFVLSDQWQAYSADFFVPTGVDAEEWDSAAVAYPVLEVALSIGSSAPVWVDDVALVRTDDEIDNPTAFNDKFVERLREYRPGIVRSWGGQLGSSLQNELAEPFARRPTGHSPRERIARTFSYSLHEFLVLAAELEAEPWYVIPPTWSAAELNGLVEYLAAPVGSSVWADQRAALGQRDPWTTVFPTIHLEYGNELWGANAGNDPFIGATLRGGQRTGAVAAARLALLRESAAFDADRLNLIVGGQYNAPETQAQIAAAGDAFDTVALAPYFGELDRTGSDADIFYPLFARPSHDRLVGDFRESLTNMRRRSNTLQTAIYEINFHSTFGRAPLSVRNGFVTGLNGGIALPLYMLTYQKYLGIREQAAFTALQYSYQIENGDYTRVWGMLRDLESTGRKRPTWLGAELANRAIRGDILQTVHGGDNPTWRQEPINGISAPVDVAYVQSFAFREGETYAIVLFNLHLRDDQVVILETETLPDPEAVRHTLTSGSIHHHNEASPLVTIASQQLEDFSQSYELQLPRHSVTVIEWGAVGAPPALVAIEQPLDEVMDGQPNSGSGTDGNLSPAAPSDNEPDTLGELWRQTQQEGLLRSAQGLETAVIILGALNVLAVGLLLFFVVRHMLRRRSP